MRDCRRGKIRTFIANTKVITAWTLRPIERALASRNSTAIRRTDLVGEPGGPIPRPLVPQWTINDKPILVGEPGRRSGDKQPAFYSQFAAFLFAFPNRSDKFSEMNELTA